MVYIKKVSILGFFLTLLIINQTDCMLSRAGTAVRSAWTGARTRLGYPVKPVPVTPQPIQPAPKIRPFSRIRAEEKEYRGLFEPEAARTLAEQYEVAKPKPGAFLKRPEFYAAAVPPFMTALIAKDPEVLLLILSDPTLLQFSAAFGLLGKALTTDYLVLPRLRLYSSDIFLNIRAIIKNTYRSSYTNDERIQIALQAIGRLSVEFDPSDLPFDIINEPGSNGLNLLQQALIKEAASSQIAIILGYGGANPHAHASGTPHPIEIAMEKYRYAGAIYKIILALVNPHIIKPEYRQPLPANIAQKVINFVQREKANIAQQQAVPGTEKYLKLADNLLELNQIEQALQLIGNLPMPTDAELQVIADTLKQETKYARPQTPESVKGGEVE